LLKHGIPPRPERGRGSWQTFLNHYKAQFLACDFFTVESLALKTLYVLFFIEHGSRRVYFAGCTPHPDTNWVTQQSRQLTWELEARDPTIRYLIHDHDTKFPLRFDAVFEREAIEIISTPFQAPNANAFAERWVRTVREECLDQLIILNEQHLRRVMREYTAYYNQRRPHQSLAQASPLGFTSEEGEIRSRPVLGGLLNDYYREAA
jgi:putative transposase